SETADRIQDRSRLPPGRPASRSGRTSPTMPPASPTPPASYVESWHPDPVRDEDPLPPGPVAAVSALLDLPEAVAGAGDPLPPLWQWFYFLHWPPQHALGPDGHLRDALFLPPIPDRQRMWAGGR